MSEAPLPDGVGRKPTPIGLIGLTVAQPPLNDDLRPLRTFAPHRTWRRFLKFSLFAVVPFGAAFVANRMSEPEGLDLSPAPDVRASGPRMMAATSDVPVRREQLPRRVFVPGAFGHSGAVRVRVVLPGELIVMPMALDGASEGLESQWIGFDGATNGPVIPWQPDGTLRAPTSPGAYWLVLSRGDAADTVADLALLVEHPMPNSRATGINGYHLGRWPRNSATPPPRGFIGVTERIADFPLSPHLRMSDFVVHDKQDAFPKYLHVREQLLDKLELTIREIAQMRGREVSTFRLHIASGYRSPAHNGDLSGSARDSRHMYGDAADIAIDANNDGSLTETDARLVAAAAEIVERKYPDLVGGVGLYINADGEGWPYVHIDVRGVRARWRGGARRDQSVDSFPAAVAADSGAWPVPAPAIRPFAAAPAAPSTTPAVTPPVPSPEVSPSGTTAAPPRPSAAPAPERTRAENSAMRPVSMVVAPSPGSSPPRTVSDGARRTDAPRATTRTPARIASRSAARSLTRAAPQRSKPVSRRGTASTRQQAVARNRTLAPVASNVVADPFTSAAKRFRASRP